MKCQKLAIDSLDIFRVEKSKTMKIFVVVQSHYADLGIRPSHPSTKKYPFSERVMLFLIFNGCTVVLHFVYIFCVANDFMEYVNCISATAATSIIFVCFGAIVVKRTLLFETIHILEKLIETSNAFPNCSIDERVQFNFIQKFTQIAN